MLKYLKISICKPTTSTNTISKASISVNEHLVHTKKKEEKRKVVCINFAVFQSETRTNNNHRIM